MKDVITINGVEYKIGISLRARIIYERITGKQIDENMKTFENIVFFFSILCAFNRDSFRMTCDEFFDYLDSNEAVYGELLTWADDYYKRKVEHLLEAENVKSKKKE